MAENGKIIWDFLKSKGFNSYGAAGILGNLETESGLRPNNLQNTSNASLNLTDEQYTEKVDNGTYKNFIYDAGGYGLAQWTYWSRKQGLLNYAKSTNRSIGDMTMQLEYLIKDLDTHGLTSKLKNAKSVQEASNIFMLQFEKPYDQSVTAQNRRANLSMNYYNKYNNSSISTSTVQPEVSSQPQNTNTPSLKNIKGLLQRGSKGEHVKLLQQALIKLGYSCGSWGADGDFGRDTEAAVIKFQRDNKLDVDGIVGPQTIGALENKLSVSSSSQPEKPSTTVTQSQIISSSNKYTASRLVEIAKSQLGYHEKASNANLDDNTANSGANNWTKYARDLAQAGYYNGNKNGYAWCDVFVDWCFYQLTNKDSKKAQDIECQTGDCGAGCVYSAQYYRRQGRYSTIPMVGDQIFFGSTGSEYHTGIVIDVTDSNIITIEGNSSDKVAQRTYPRYYSSINGFGHPKYEPETTTPVASSKSTDTALNIAGYITADVLNIRSGPSTSETIIGTLQKGESVIITDISNNWGKINSGWISLDYFKQAT